MDEAPSLEIYCPNCRQHIVPLQGAVSWYCANCAWQFSDAEIDRQRKAASQAGKPDASEARPPDS